MTGLNELRDAAYRNAVEHGWWDEVRHRESGGGILMERGFAEVIALIHSEASEALEGWRDGYATGYTYFTDGGVHKDHHVPEDASMGLVWVTEYGWKPEGVPSEFADIIIRVLDACGAYGIDIDEAVRLKMEFNRTRPFKNGRAV
jgi:hypothetical protein